jgi:predicted phosphoadenosine phosphosulfate sulfurtransferase
MSIKRIEGSMNVVEAAERRILNAFSNGVRVYLSFSAGKDSLCMAHLVYKNIMAGRIDPKQLVVIFIDEEALYESMEKMALEWRRRFMACGAEFRWYCLPLKQVSGFQHLANEESWITWEPGQEAVWVRQPPPWAICRSPYLEYPGQMNYQNFCTKITRDGLQIIGIRASESVQRLQYVAAMNVQAEQITSRNGIAPIYDWKDSDVWLYIKENNLYFPEAYMDLYSAGVDKHRLRLSQFFATDSCASLRKIAETNPDLWDRIQKREPNAYLTLLYWDSEMFKRSTRNRSKMESGEPKKDYKALLKDMLFIRPERYFTNSATRYVAERYRRFYIKNADVMTDASRKMMYEALIAGDPKLRTLRALFVNVYTSYANYNRADLKKREEATRA